ncbi:MAG: hypothetical protein K1060chlam2_00977 [Chlamydiae bacterium]|nr:hypothetical protein [Chlamydiota bacterium]
MEKTHKPILLLYYTPTSPPSQEVLNFLKEIDKEIPLKNVEDDPKANDELLHLGGKAQVPCLFIDGMPLYEAEVIIDWLREKKDNLE